MKRIINGVIELLEMYAIIVPKKYKNRLFTFFFISVFQSFFELLGVAAILPFVQSILSPEILLNNPRIAQIVKTLKLVTKEELVFFCGICIIVLYIIKNVYILFALYYQNSFAMSVQKDISVNMLNSFMNRPFSYYQNVNSVEVIRGVESDTITVFSTITAFFGIITELFSCVCIGIYILYSDIFIALGVIAVMLVTMMGIVFVLKPITKKLADKNLVAWTRKSKAVLQASNGMKELMVMNRRKLFLDEYEKGAEMYRKTNCNFQFVSNAPDRIVEAMCVSGMILVVLFRLITDQDGMQQFVPKLATFAMAAFKLMPSVGKITSKINSIIFYRPQVCNVYNNIVEAEKYEKEMRSYSLAHTDGEIIELDGEEERHFEREININNITWSYSDSVRPVLTGVSLQIKKGTSVAFIGESGAGKTTLADIVLGLYKPQKGSVYMDGIDIYTIPRTWAKIIGYVPQYFFLLDDTIRANVEFGAKNFTDEEIWDSLDKAAIGEYIRSLPNKLDTVVGERGIKFSGGQRQRIAVARALLSKPEVLVLDEATSALDNESEKVIMESIDSLHGSVTLIVIAHRLSTIINCDFIYQIVDGKAVLCNKDALFS